MKNKKQLSLTVGITTCFGGESILDNVRSIRHSKDVGYFDLIIIADRVPISDKVKAELKKLNVKLIENKHEGSQFKKKKQILKLVNTDLVIFTNDDVLFDPNTLKETVNEFQKHKKITLISVLNQPLKSDSIVENAISVGTHIVNRIVKTWNKGDNYLSVIGRYEAIRTDWIKKYFRMDEDVVSSDQYVYFENKKTGGKYKFLPNVAIYFRNPQNLKEHLRKSSRFQYSKQEMSKYFQQIEAEYKIPTAVALKAIVAEFIDEPFYFIIYLLTLVYTRLFRLASKRSLNAIWQIDMSTKALPSIL